MDRRDNRRAALDRRQQAIQELDRRGLWGYVEPILTMGSAAIAEPVSGLVGLAALPYGAEAATRAINRTQEAMTYQPRTEQGQENLQAAGEFMQPVGDAFIGASEYLGDAAYNATGSPALGAAAYSIPTMALEALGLKGARYASKGRAAYEMGDIGSQASRVGGKQRGIFAGVKAKGADLDAKAAAEELANRGIDRKEIWDKTGWFEDVDGSWKWEIDDSGAALRDEGLRSFHNESDLVRQNRMMTHSLLSDAYPDTDSIPYRKGEFNGASYDPASDTIKLPQDAGHPDMFPEFRDKNVKSPALHELQHAIQEREGFARGGSPEQFIDSDLGESLVLQKNLRERYRQSKELGRDVYGTDASIDELKGMVLQANSEVEQIRAAMRAKLSPLDQYKRLAGEAEARNVQTRMNMTPDERRAKAPWETLDVPESELIVKRDGGVMQSVDFDRSTGYADVDEKISLIKEMTPDEYLQQAFEATDGRLGGSFEDWMRSNARSQNDVDAYAKAMQEGDNFPLPYIDFDIGSQDGRNRALAAKRAGARTIPVGIVEKPSAVERIAQIKQEMKAAKGYGLHRLTEELGRLEKEIK